MCFCHKQCSVNPQPSTEEFHRCRNQSGVSVHTPSCNKVDVCSRPYSDIRHRAGSSIDCRSRCQPACAKDCTLCESGFRTIVSHGLHQDMRNCSQTCKGQQGHIADLVRSEKSFPTPCTLAKVCHREHHDLTRERKSQFGQQNSCPPKCRSHDLPSRVRDTVTSSAGSVSASTSTPTPPAHAQSRPAPRHRHRQHLLSFAQPPWYV